MGLLLSSIYRFLLVSVLFLIILPYLPDTLFPEFSFDPVPLQSLDYEKVASNYKFTQVSNQHLNHWLKDQIVGAESLLVKGNLIYTGLGDGRLVEINKKTNNIRTVTRFNRPGAKDCGDNVIKNATSCGRVLGLHFGKDNNLYALDASQGLFKVDITKGTKQLVSLGPLVPSSLKGLFNDFVFDPELEDVLYITVSTSRWPMNMIIWAMLEGESSGFVLSLNLKTGKLVKILDNLKFVNSITLSADKKNLLISETNAHRVLKVPLIQAHDAAEKGAKITNPAVLIDNLPGNPDNIRVINNELAIAVPLAKENATLLDKLIAFPMVRKSIARAAHLSSRFLRYINSKFFNCHCLQTAEVDLTNGHLLIKFLPSSANLIFVDTQTGKVKKSYKFEHDGFSEAHIDPVTGDLYLASFKNRFIGHVKSKDLK